MIQYYICPHCLLPKALLDKGWVADESKKFMQATYECTNCKKSETFKFDPEKKMPRPEVEDAEKKWKQVVKV